MYISQSKQLCQKNNFKYMFQKVNYCKKNNNNKHTVMIMGRYFLGANKTKVNSNHSIGNHVIFFKTLLSMWISFI